MRCRPRGCESLLAENARVPPGHVLHRVLEGELSRQEARGKTLGIEAGFAACAKVEAVEILEDHAHIAIRVVDRFESLLDALHRVFDELDHLGGVPFAKELFEPGDYVLDAARVVSRRSVVDEESIPGATVYGVK